MKYNLIEGNYNGKGKKFGIVLSRFNNFITKNLLEGAIDAFVRHGVNEEDITVHIVPGAFEIPLAVQKMAETKEHNGIVALGAIIRGSTPHFDFVASECAKGVAQAMMKTGVPIAFGVLTTDTIEQAIERAGTKSGNKGAEAAMTAIELSNLYAK